MITFLFTDIEGSTKLWERAPEAMRMALRRHDLLLRQVFESDGGHVFKLMGDAFCVAFRSPDQAVGASIKAQLALESEQWDETGPLRVRAAIHTGSAEVRDDDYFGPTLNRVARLLSIGHGRQILISGAAYAALTGPEVHKFTDLGSHRLKDLTAPERVRMVLVPDGAIEFPPLKSLEYLPTNLPSQLSSFVGRVVEIDLAKELLKASRMLTITGSGGTGKTRTSLQIAADQLDEFPDGVWFVELAALTDATAFYREVARVLNIREAPGTPILDTILAEIEAKRMLLVLDNCEHILDGVAGFARKALQTCPSVKILATSREAVGVAGERIYRLPSMGLPDRDGRYTPASLVEYESVQLFRDRARLANAGFEVTEQNSGSIAAVCQRLDGIPLAIELAAARIRAMSVEEVEKRLDVPFRLLTGGGRDVLPRQQTLRALIDWSYDLLTEGEKTLLRRLSVFRGGWRLADVESGVAYGEIEIWEVLDLLTSLVDKSLVVFEENAGDSRYRLLETVRQYGWERLTEKDETAEAIEHHLKHYGELTAECMSYCNGPHQAIWLERLAREHDNVRFAHENALAGYGIKTGLKLCRDLRSFWMIRGFVLEGVDVCDRALQLDVGTEFVVERGFVLTTRGTLCSLISRFDQAIQDLAEAVAIFEPAHELEALGLAEDALGTAIRMKGGFAEAIPHYERSLEVIRRVGNLRGEAVTLNNLGRCAEYLGDLQTAKKYQEECLLAIRKVGEPRTLAIFLFSLALVEMKLDELEGAAEHFSESVREIRKVGDPLGVANLLEAMATLACRRKLFGRAVVMWGAAEMLRENLGAPMVAADRSTYEGNVEQARQNLEPELFDSEWQRGRKLSLDEAVDFAAGAHDA